MTAVAVFNKEMPVDGHWLDRDHRRVIPYFFIRYRTLSRLTPKWRAALDWFQSLASSA